MPRKKKTEIEEKVGELKEKVEGVMKDIKEKAENVKKKVEEKVEELESKKEKKDKEEIKKEIKEGKSDFDSHQKSEKLKLISEKAKKLAKEIKARDIKEEVTSKKEGTIFPLDDYVKYSCHLGTKAVTPNMRQHVYKRRADGLAVLNTNAIDKKLKEAVEFMASFPPEDIFLACKREAGWGAVKKFYEVTGIRVFTKKYPAGIISNTELEDFFETELVIICDPWLDKNALNDAVRTKKPVIGLCDTNNLTKGITKVIPCNNKAAKSLGLILYLLSREYLKARGEKTKLNIKDFTGEVEEKKSKEDKGAKEGV